MRVHVLVADADPLICEGLAESLSEEPGLLAHPSTDPVDLAVERCRQLGSSVLLLSETHLDGLDALRFAEQLDWGRAQPVLVLGARSDHEKVLRCLRLGCVGYVHRQQSLAVLRKAVYAVAAGQIWAPRTVLTVLLRQLIDGQSGAPRLTGREREILALIGDGCSNHLIAAHLFISPETVRWHVRRLFGKIGVHSRAQAAEFARHTLLPLRRERSGPPAMRPVQSAAWSEVVAGAA